MMTEGRRTSRVVMRGTWRSRIVAGAVASVVLVPTTTMGQGVEGGRAGPRAVLDRDFEIGLALSAAPAAVAGNAKVLVWNGSGFDTAVEGTNDVTCYVARSWPESLEPHCFDAEGSVTILPIHLRQMELWNEGRSPEEIETVIAQGLITGAFRLPRRPAMSYMMSAGQDLIGDDGEPAGSWMPHLMIYFPFLSAEDLGLGPEPSTAAAIVVDPGTPLSNIMIVVRDFVPVGFTDSGRHDGSR